METPLVNSRPMMDFRRFSNQCHVDAGGYDETPPSGRASSAPPQRLVTRVVMEFLIRVVAAAAKAHDGDFKAMVVFMAIQHANTEHLESDPESAALYFGGFPPDAIRRPISVHALSQSLSLPPETGRRYVNRLVERGYCQRVGDRGVIVPNQVMGGDPFSALNRETYDAFIRMLIDFRTINFDLQTAAGARIDKPARRAAAALTSPEHAVGVLVTGYLIRVILDGVPLYGKDLVRGLLFVTVMAMNVEHITFDPAQAWRFADAASVPPDEMRTPVSIRALSARLNLPYETTRRHVMRLVANGDMVRVDGGVVTPASAMRDPRRVRSGLDIYVWLLRVISQLAQLGFDFNLALDSGSLPGHCKS